MIKWEEIEKLYPKAHEDFEDWYYVNYSSTPWNLWSVRELYDFFDNYDIMINVFPFFSNFLYKINYNFKDEIKSENKFMYRKNAEEEAFIQAFEMLEERLRNKKR